MPVQAPRFRPAGYVPPEPWATSRGKTRQERGYGREHDRIRKQVLKEEPLCRACQAQGRVSATVIADHIIPLSQGGRTIRSNYQGLCQPCSDAKTAAESRSARGQAGG